MESGIQADILVCRTEHELSEDLRAKLALFCNVEKKCGHSIHRCFYHLWCSQSHAGRGLDRVALRKLQLDDTQEPNLVQWNQFLLRHKNPKGKVTIGLIGKYVELQDSYKSILESFIHGASNELSVEVIPIHSEHIDAANIEKWAKRIGWYFW